MLPAPEPALPALAASADPALQPAVVVGWQANAHEHRKLLVVDSVIAFTGGVEISRVEDQAAAGEPRIGHREVYIALLLAIANARQRVWLTDGYFVLDGRMLHALERAAQRGVDVRLVVPGRDDAWMPFNARRARYGELLGVGVRIFERRDALLPTKTAAAGGIWTGFDPGSDPGGSYGPDLMAFDRSLARQLEQLFQLDEAASREVSLAEWRRRGLANRLKEWLARCCELIF